MHNIFITLERKKKIEPKEVLSKQNSTVTLKTNIMKKIFKSICLVSICCLASVHVSQAQIKVWSDGAVKIGDLSKATNLNGSSLEVAVNTLFIYPTNNLNGAFKIYNNTQNWDFGIGTIGQTSSSLGIGSNFDLPTYIEPYKAGRLNIGTSSKPLGAVCAQSCVTYSQSMASDSRVKTNILDIPSALEAIRLLRPVSFDYNLEKLPMNPTLATGHAGFIAQEVKEVLPNLVKYDTSADLYNLDYISLIPYLTKAIQEQDSLLLQQQTLLQAYAEAVADLSEQLTELEAILNTQTKAPTKAPKASTNNEIGIKTSQNTLYQNVPNPSDCGTRIRYELIESTNAHIGIYELDGKEIAIYPLTDIQGEIVVESGALNPGMYLYSLIVNGQIQDTKRMVITQ